MHHKFNCIFWDLGGVLFSNAQISEPEFAHLRRAMDMSAKTSDEIFDQLWPQGVRIGKMTEDEFWTHHKERARRKFDIQRIKYLYRRRIVANDELLRVVRRLASKRYRQFIISNHGNEWMRHIVKRWNLERYFEEIFCSAWLGVAKPDSQIFQIALDESQANPQKSLFIDDSEKNIDAAKSLGISGIIYKDNNQLISDLRQLWIL